MSGHILLLIFSFFAFKYEQEPFRFNLCHNIKWWIIVMMAALKPVLVCFFVFFIGFNNTEILCWRPVCVDFEMAKVLSGVTQLIRKSKWNETRREMQVGGGGVTNFINVLKLSSFFRKNSQKRKKNSKNGFFYNRKKITDYYDKYLKLGRRKEILEDVLPSQLTLRVRNKTHSEEALDNK